MGVSLAIKAIRMAGGEMTSQHIADFAKQTWHDWRRALNAGDKERAEELEKEFSELCKLFQES